MSPEDEVRVREIIMEMWQDITTAGLADAVIDALRARTVKGTWRH